jgi:hypothetical protein
MWSFESVQVSPGIISPLPPIVVSELIMWGVLLSPETEETNICLSQLPFVLAVLTLRPTAFPSSLLSLRLFVLPPPHLSYLTFTDPLFATPG